MYMTALPCSTASRRSPKAPSLGSTAKDLEASPPPHSWPLSAHHLTSAPAGSPRHSDCLARLFGRTSPIDERFIWSSPVAKAAAAALVVAVAPLAVAVAAASRLDAAAAAAAAVVAAAAEARVVVLPAMAVGTLASDSVVCCRGGAGSGGWASRAGIDGGGWGKGGRRNNWRIKRR